MISVAVVGRGTIGGAVAEALAAGEVPGARLSGIIIRNGSSRFPVLPLTRAVEVSDLVVEAGGQQALTEMAPVIMGSRASLLVTAVGALRDEATFKLLAAAPGRVYLTTGAIGGLDMLRSAARMAPLESVRIVSTKSPAALIQPWMSPAEQAALLSATAPVEVKRGSAKQIAGLFPASTNVAAAVAMAAGNWDVVEAVVMADPDVVMTSHVITASGPSGEYRFEIRNRPSPDNPRTSKVVAYAVLKSIEDIAGSAAWSFR